MKKRIRLIFLLLSAVMLICCLSACQNDIPDKPQMDYIEKTILTYSQNGNYLFSAPEAPCFEELPTKNMMGLKLTEPNSKFSFSANCEGDVSLYIWTSTPDTQNTETTVKISIDGISEDSINIISSGSNITIARSLPRGNHTFTIEKLSGNSNLYIASVTVCGVIVDSADTFE